MNKLQLFLLHLCLRLPPAPRMYYIGGSDTLPPPLEKPEEEAAIAALTAGDEEARQTLIEHNLRLVVYIARRFEAPDDNTTPLWKAPSHL